MCIIAVVFVFFFFFKQKTAYEMRISDWSSDVCSSDLLRATRFQLICKLLPIGGDCGQRFASGRQRFLRRLMLRLQIVETIEVCRENLMLGFAGLQDLRSSPGDLQRSEEHTSELQSLMRISYAVFCLKKKKNKTITRQPS